MALEDFLDHKCTIYHMGQSTNDLGYGISDEHAFCYPGTAEEKDRDVPCHFGIKSGNYIVSQGEPLNGYTARVKLTLPIWADIRINDKVVSSETGFSYIAELPRKIRGHHTIVYVHRQGTVKEAL